MAPVLCNERQAGEIAQSHINLLWPTLHPPEQKSMLHSNLYLPSIITVDTSTAVALSSTHSSPSLPGLLSSPEWVLKGFFFQQKIQVSTHQTTSILTSIRSSLSFASFKAKSASVCSCHTWSDLPIYNYMHY